MRSARLVLVTLTVGAFAAALTGCSTGGGGTSQGPNVTETITSTAVPHPVKTVIRDYPTFRAGQTGTITSRTEHAGLSITVSPKSVSTTRLSPTYGHPPANGHYVTFVLTIRNTGEVPIPIHRLDFFVTTPGVKKTTTNDGQAPYSGSGTQLDSTALTAGQHVTNNLTFDVRTPTGTLFYAPSGQKSMAWTF